MKKMSVDPTIVASLMSVTSLHSTPCTSAFHRLSGCLEPAQGSHASCYFSLRGRDRLLPWDLIQLELLIKLESAFHTFHWQNLGFSFMIASHVFVLAACGLIKLYNTIFCSWIVSVIFCLIIPHRE